MPPDELKELISDATAKYKENQLLAKGKKVKNQKVVCIKTIMTASQELKVPVRNAKPMIFSEN